MSGIHMCAVESLVCYKGSIVTDAVQAKHNALFEIRDSKKKNRAESNNYTHIQSNLHNTPRHHYYHGYCNPGLQLLPLLLLLPAAALVPLHQTKVTST